MQSPSGIGSEKQYQFPSLRPDFVFMFCSKAIFGALSLVSKTKSAESHRMDISTWWIYSEKSSLLIATFGNYLLKELFHPKMKICWTCTPSDYPMCWWVCFFIVTDLEKFSISSLALQWTGVMWITCRLLWCFYQLFGLSSWRHPFTAEDPLVSKWCRNAKFL